MLNNCCKRVLLFVLLVRSSALQSPPPRGLDARLFGLNSALIESMKGGIDLVYKDRDLARFLVLETVARVPYFAFCSVLHFRETFGERNTELIRLHYAEADNELHHLLIMEHLCRDLNRFDSALAAALSVVAFWYSCLVYASCPRAAYHLSELIEDHAYHTYDSFLNREEKYLKSQPVPCVASDYYTSKHSSQHRPLTSLYDVFLNVRDDEKDHWSTLCSLEQYDEIGHSCQHSTKQSSPEFIHKDTKGQ